MSYLELRAHEYVRESPLYKPEFDLAIVTAQGEEETFHCPKLGVCLRHDDSQKDSLMNSDLSLPSTFKGGGPLGGREVILLKSGE